MFTKNYIKMCEKAEEIQKAWKPKQFDSYGSEEYKKAFILDELGMINHIEKYKSSYKWLPTQEQLFKILNTIDGFWQLTYRDYKGEKVNILTYFLYYQKTEFVDKEIKTVLIQMIMKQKYSKTWTGEKWEKADK